MKFSAIEQLLIHPGHSHIVFFVLRAPDFSALHLCISKSIPLIYFGLAEFLFSLNFIYLREKIESYCIELKVDVCIYGLNRMNLNDSAIVASFVVSKAHVVDIFVISFAKFFRYDVS